MIEEENFDPIYTQYFYSSVLEFFYFIIIYIESYGFIFLTDLSKHIKFFKVEVKDFVLTFSGNTPEEKLYKMLHLVNCFEFSENKIKLNKKICLRNFIFEDLIVAKAVDLVLKGSTTVKDIHKNLNFNNVIFIEKDNLVNILQRSSHFSIKNNHLVSAVHIHGILGFDEYICNLIINYFQNILCHNQTLPYNKLEHHTQFISSCELHHMLGILCTLFCSNAFICKDGQIKLDIKSKKHPKQEILSMDLLRKSTLEDAVPVGKIVHHIYGSYIQRWTGEIGSLNQNCGYIYCVVDFTNGHQCIFSVYFNKSALKVISEICNLKEHLQLRDFVEFDAVYCDSRKLDNYWIATKVKLLNTARITYDELLFDKLKCNAKIKRRNYLDIKYCLNNSSDIDSCYHTPKNHRGAKDNEEKGSHEYLFSKMLECDNNTDKISSTRFDVTNKCTKLNLKSSGVEKPVSNLLVPDFLILFGHIFVLMEDKGIAIAKQGNKYYKIVFLRESIYPPNKSQSLFAKGQKILAFVPFIEEVESLVIATFIYGLTSDETEVTEEHLTDPREFTKTLLPNISKDLLSNCCNVVNGLLTGQSKNFVKHSLNTAHIFRLHNFIISQCKVAFDNNKLLQFLNNLFKIYSHDLLNNCFIYPFIKLSKRLKNKYTVQGRLQVKCKRKYKSLHGTTSDKYDLKTNYDLKEIYNSSLIKNVTKCRLSSNSKLSVKSKSLDFKKDSFSSLSSYKSCCSVSSFETFYSCNSNEKISKSFESLPENVNFSNSNGTKQKNNEDFVFDVEQIPPPINLSNIFTFPLDNFKKDFDSQMILGNDTQYKLKKVKKSKCFALQSFPFLKPVCYRNKRTYTPKPLNPVHEGCCEDPVKRIAQISVITDSFFFYNVNINDCDVVLPVSKTIIPEILQEKMRLNTYNEITVIPNALANLSHILIINVMC